RTLRRKSVRFAGLTIASSASVVRWPTTTSSRAGPTSAKINGADACLGFAIPGPMLHQNGSRFCSAPLRAALRPGHDAVASSRPFGAGLGQQIDTARDPDVVEMRVEEIARRAAAAVAQHHEEIVVGAQLAVGRELAERVVERDAVQLDAAILAGPDAVRQPALVDQSRDELDRAQFP